MNRNVLIVMAGGLLVAVLVAMIVQATLKGDRKKQPVKEEARVQIVVASKALKAGEALSESNMKWVDWPKAGVFEGMLLKEGNKKITDIASGKVRRAMALNEPITKASLVVQKANFLAASLSPGMRAVAINASARSAAGGFVSPGDYVDIILNYRPRINMPGGNNDAATRTIIQENITGRAAETIMQNIKVLAVDQRASRNEEKVQGGKVYTMEVDPKGAQILSMADSVGTLELVLRPLGDDKINERLPAATDARMTHLYDELVQIRDEKRGGGMHNIRIFSGNSMQQLGVSP